MNIIEKTIALEESKAAKEAASGRYTYIDEEGFQRMNRYMGLAVLHNDADAVKMLIRTGFDVNKAAYWPGWSNWKESELLPKKLIYRALGYQTPLSLAINLGKIAAITALLESGAQLPRANTVLHKRLIKLAKTHPELTTALL